MAQTGPVSEPFVYVVTVAWNGCQDTLRCLDSLLQLQYSNFRVVLVDNGSVDGTAQMVREKFPQVEIIVNPTNVGFSGGFNIGLRYALEQHAELIFMINNDTWVAPDLLVELVAHAQAPEVGMLAPKIYSASEPKRIWSVGGQRNRWTLEMTDIGDGQLDTGQWQSVMEREYLVGCALLIRRQLLETVGLFDDACFGPAYYEDSDFSLRARRAGMRLLMVPSAQMWHKGAESSGGFDSPQQRYYMARNSVRFFRKHVRGLRWLIVVPWRLGSAVKTTVRLLRAGRWQAVRAYWRGLRDGLAGRACAASG
jgi:GT2 family glycosyltransferase